jgi:cysteine sulfinate desulfinase/cysteine desulfurase-like protein
MMVNNEIGVQQPIKEIGMSIDLFNESIEIYF